MPDVKKKKRPFYLAEDLRSSSSERKQPTLFAAFDFLEERRRDDEAFVLQHYGAMATVDG